MSSSQPVGTHQGDPDLIDSLEQLLIKELTNLKIKTKESKPLIIAPKRQRSQDLPLIKSENFELQIDEFAFKDDSMEPLASNMEESKEQSLSIENLIQYFDSPDLDLEYISQVLTNLEAKFDHRPMPWTINAIQQKVELIHSGIQKINFTVYEKKEDYMKKDDHVQPTMNLVNKCQRVVQKMKLKRKGNKFVNRLRQKSEENKGNK